MCCVQQVRERKILSGTSPNVPYENAVYPYVLEIMTGPTVMLFSVSYHIGQSGQAINNASFQDTFLNQIDG